MECSMTVMEQDRSNPYKSVSTFGSYRGDTERKRSGRDVPVDRVRESTTEAESFCTSL
jgi:hypothetical protein